MTGSKTSSEFLFPQERDREREMVVCSECDSVTDEFVIFWTDSFDDVLIGEPHSFWTKLRHPHSFCCLKCFYTKFKVRSVS